MRERVEPAWLDPSSDASRCGWTWRRPTDDGVPRPRATSSTSIRSRSRTRAARCSFRRSSRIRATSTWSCTASTCKQGSSAVRHARRRLLPRPQLPRHRPRRRSRAAIAALRERLRSARAHARRGPGRPAAPHRRLDGGQLPPGDRSARGRASTSSRRRRSPARSSSSSGRCIKLKRELASLRRVLMPQRDAIGRLARREFAAISDEMAFRFRDVYDHVVRLSRRGDPVPGPRHRHPRSEPRRRSRTA